MQLLVDDVSEEYKEAATVFQFCSGIRRNLPCFCYMESLTIAGNCRICLVEVNGTLAVSCAIPIVADMQVYTLTRRVKKSRGHVLEFLLCNHPLDCPVCDQGGECDLQDITITFGFDRGRFYEYIKRSVDNLNVCGPLIKTVMTRCIHCTRCVRFFSEYTNFNSFGVLGRGLNMEIGTYINDFYFDEFSGNVIDICPVGALTAMPFSFISRSWELSVYYSFDVLDCIMPSVRFDVLNNKIVRVLPNLDEVINNLWITNKTRMYYDL